MAPKFVFLWAFCVCMCPMRYLFLVFFLFFFPLFPSLFDLFYSRLCVSICLFVFYRKRQKTPRVGWVGSIWEQMTEGKPWSEYIIWKEIYFQLKENRKLAAEENIFLTNTTKARLRYLAHDKFEHKNQLVNNSNRTGHEQFTYKIKWSIAHEKCLFPLLNKGYYAREWTLTP